MLVVEIIIIVFYLGKVCFNIVLLKEKKVIIIFSKGYL